MLSQNPIVSVIVPCYNEEEVLLACHSRLLQVFEAYDDQQFELIYVNDGSSDRTEELLRYLHDAYPQTRVVMLSRNFGHQAAVTAGLTAATAAFQGPSPTTSWMALCATNSTCRSLSEA